MVSDAALEAANTAPREAVPSHASIPSLGHAQHQASPYVPVLPRQSTWPSQLWQGHTPVTLPQLLLCFCQLARAMHCFPQGPNKGTNAWPGASLPIPIGSAHREGWQMALYFYCSFSQTSKHQQALLRNIMVISVPGSQADIRNLLSPGV